jgi:8-oxo-dGTP pyrophosphatase MutT (NUDIX family)
MNLCEKEKAMRQRGTAIIERDGKILLVRDRGARSWSLPGGGIKRHEPSMSAASREASEELGVRITRGKRLPMCDFQSRHNYHRVSAVKISGDPKINLHELEDMMWWDGEESIPMYDHVRVILDKYRKNYPKAAFRMSSSPSESEAKMAGIGTGKIVSTYIRPRLEEISRDDLDRRMKLFNGTKISQNVYVLRTEKSRILPKTYMTDVVFHKMGKYFIANIPTDKNGNISQLNMAERLLDTDSGDRTGHMRNVMIDCSVDALKVATLKEKAQIYNWWIYPNESDVEKIDDSKTMIAEILGKGTKWGRMKCLIVGGTQDQREKIAKDITANFTIREKRIINNCLIEIAPSNRSYAGCFQGTTDSAGNIMGTPKIVVTDPYVKNSDVIIHESVHALRQFDQSRDKRLQAVKHYWGRDHDLEESLTEAETTGRQKPFEKGDNYKAGYYHHIRIPGKSSGELVKEDRITLTGSFEKAKKGKRVQKSVIVKFPMMNISKLKMKGDAEAVDTFYELDRKVAGGKTVTSHIQLFKPDATTKDDRAQDRALDAETSGEIREWKDGKLEVIDKGEPMNAYEYGQRGYKNGLKASAQDKEFQEKFLKGKAVGDPESKKALEDWMRGWTKAHYDDHPVPKTKAEYDSDPYWRSKQAEYTEKMKPYQQKFDANIKKVNDQFMAGKMSLKEMNAKHDELNRELEEKADMIRSEMGFPTAKSSSVVKGKRSGKQMVQDVMNEVIIYGGLPVRRADVYKDALKETGDKKAADMFAFGSQTKLAPEGTVPFTYDQLQDLRKKPMGTPPAKKKDEIEWTKEGYGWTKDNRLVYPSGTQLGRVHHMADNNEWWAIVGGSVIGVHKSKKAAMDHVERLSPKSPETLMKEKSTGKSSMPVRNRSENFRRPSEKPKKRKKKPKNQGKFGPYFTKGGRISKRPIRG